jgi:hypothetical protein
MRNKLMITLLFLITINVAHAQEYVPRSEKYVESPYGARVNLHMKVGKKNLKGELISIDTEHVVVLEEDSKKCYKLKTHEIKSIKLKYADNKHFYWYFSAVVAVLPFINGKYSLISVPVHVATTTAVAYSADKEFTNYYKAINVNEISKFARFPQGLPEGLSIASIK